MSDNLKITCAIPQGSCLGPLLFLLYINNLSTASNVNTTLFADDTLLILSDRSIGSLQQNLT